MLSQVLANNIAFGLEHREWLKGKWVLVGVGNGENAHFLWGLEILFLLFDLELEDSF